MSSIQKQLARFEKWCSGILGVSAMHLPSMQVVQHNADHPFLLCSVYKIPIAVCLLQKIARGEIDLDDMCEITEFDLRPGMASTLNQLQYSTPVKMSIVNLLYFMLQESCNTATDLILRLIGGPTAVMDSLKNAGIKDLRVDCFTLEAIAAWDGIQTLPSDHRCTLQQYKILEQQVSPTVLGIARKTFKEDMRDRGTPAALCQLLLKIKNHEMLSQKHAELLFTIMRRCKTGAQRIMGLLPGGTPVSHKTGTLTGYTNDVGIISLPDDHGEILLAIFVEDSQQPVSKDERVIAEVARTLYDYFLLCL
jgi:beta-lactamase class A